jgi:hypothetical protein
MKVDLPDPFGPPAWISPRRISISTPAAPARRRTTATPVARQHGVGDAVTAAPADAGLRQPDAPRAAPPAPLGRRGDACA